MTLSGKHIWRKYMDGYKEVKDDMGGSYGVPKYLIKCIACGMVDDLNE